MNIQDQPKGSRERTLDEVKAEFMRRAGKLNPFEDIKREDAETVMAALKNLDKDHWAEEWSKIGLGYEAKGDAAAKAGASGKELAELYMHAFDACRVGRYPSPTSPGKLAGVSAFASHVPQGGEAFRSAARDHRSAVRRQEARRLSAEAAGRRPSRRSCMHWGGVDGWKEDRLQIAKADRWTPASPRSPSTCRAAARTRCCTAIPSAERTYLAWLDYLPTRTDVDGKRVAVWGGSFGAYWAARLAFTAADRIKGAVFHGGNVHYGFQREWLVPAFTTGGATYLFGAASLLDARGRAMGVKTLEEFLAAAPPLSLKTMGLLDKPSAPLLGVNGKLDDQAPVADIYLLLEHGNPKSARVYPTATTWAARPASMPTRSPTRSSAG